MHRPGRSQPRARRIGAIAVLAIVISIAVTLGMARRAPEPALASNDDPHHRQYQHAVMNGADAASAWSALADAHGH